MTRTALNAILFFSLIMLITVSCGDDDNPVEVIGGEFVFRVEVTDPANNPVADLQVSAWNKLSGIAIGKPSPAGSYRTRLDSDPGAASIQAGETGDINCNDMAYEVADMVMYANYFVEDLDAFTDEQCAIGASDVNPDGNALTISDLVCLIGVVNGEITPPTQALDSVEANIGTGMGRLRITSDVQIGAVWVKFVGDATPILTAPGMEMLSNFNVTYTYALVYSPEGNSFTGDALDFGSEEIVGIECATSDGRPVKTTISPTDIVFEQNYPNPFNGQTILEYATAVAIDYQVAINDLEASPVQTYNGTVQAGVWQTEWNASDCRSGVYPCMFTAWAAGTDTMLYADTIAAVVYNMDADLDELGYTGADGVFETARYLYFPHLYDLPPMIATDPTGTLTGDFSFSDTMVVLLTDTGTSQAQTHEVVVGETANVFRFTWDPTQ